MSHSAAHTGGAAAAPAARATRSCSASWSCSCSASASPALAAVGYVVYDRRLRAAAGLAQAARPGLELARCSPPTARGSASSRPTSCACRSTATRSRRSLKDATVAIEDQRFYKHKGVDYEGIVRAAVKNIIEPQDGAGRLDDHDAARPQPLHRTARERHAATSARSARPSSPRSSRTSTPRTGSSTKYLNTVPVRHASAARPAIGVGPPRASTSTSRVEQADAARGRAARRPAAGAVACTRRCARPRRPRRAATRCWRKMAELRDDHAGAGARRSDGAGPRRCTCRRYFTQPPRGLLLRLRQGRADQGVRRRRPSRSAA